MTTEEEQVRKRYPEAVLEQETRWLGNRPMLCGYSVWNKPALKVGDNCASRILFGLGPTVDKAWEDAANWCRKHGGI